MFHNKAPKTKQLPSIYGASSLLSNTANKINKNKILIAYNKNHHRLLLNIYHKSSIEKSVVYALAV